MSHWVAFGVFMVATIYVYYRVTSLPALMSAHIDLSGRRRIIGRGFTAIGIWQLSIGWLLIIVDGWANAISVIGVGLLMLLLGRYPMLFDPH